MGDPTKVYSDGNFKDWKFSNPDDAFSAPISCPGNCHASNAAPKFSKNSPFFMADTSLLSKPGFKTSGLHNPALLKWLQDQKDTATPETPKPGDGAPTPVKMEEKPDAETIKKFTDKGLEFEKDAEQNGLTTEEKLLNLQAALACYQRASDPAKAEKVQKLIRSIYGQEGDRLQKEADKAGLAPEGKLKILHGALIQFQGAGDVEKAKAVLEKIRATYEGQGNEMGKAYAQAQLAFLNWDPKGSTEKLDEAIRLYDKIDQTLSQNSGSLGLKPEESESIRADLRLKRFAAYLKRGEYLASQQKFKEAEKDLSQALTLNPSKPLLQFYLEVGYQSGLFDFARQDGELFTLRMKEGRQNLRPKKDPCPSCHSSPADTGAFRPITENSPEFDPQIGQKISDLEKRKEEGTKRFNEVVALVYSEPANLDERYERDLFVAERLEKFGKPFEAEKIYERIVEERKNATHPKQIIQRSMAQNQLAVFCLSRRDTVKARDWLKVSLSGVDALPEGAEKKFLTMQARMVEAESYLADGNVDKARSILEEATKIPAGDAGTLQYKMAGKLKVRLAQIYYSKKETFGLGDALAETIKKNYPANGDPAHGEIVGDVFFAKALSRVGTGRALEAVGILREEVQKPFPNSSVARALATDSRFSKFLKESTDAKGNRIWVLKESSEINEADWGELFKVAIVRSGEGPMERKVAYGAAGGLGVAAALAMAPEPVATKVAAVLVGIGVGVGLLWERFVTGTEHSDEIYDAYRTGLSPISNEEYMMGLGLFGLDVACLLTAGLAGQVVKGTVRLGMGWTARQIASPLLRTGIEIYGEDLALWAGRGILYASEQTAFAFSSSYLYEAQKSLILGHEMKWTSGEALEWLFMGEFIQTASRTAFLGTAVAKSPFFQRGLLKEIRVDGKVVGQTTSEGLGAKWLVDASAGLSAFYGAKKLAHFMKGDTGKENDPKYLEFLIQNLYTMGLLHAGEAAGRKLMGNSVEVLLGRMDKKANQSFAEAKKILYSDPPQGGGWGLQPAWAGAYGMPSRLDFSSKPKSFFSPGILMMSSLGPFEDKLMEKDIWGIENDHAVNPEKVTVKVEVEKGSEVDVVAEAADGHLPKEVKRLEIVTPELPDAATIFRFSQMARKMGLEIVLTNKGTQSSLKIDGEQIRVGSTPQGVALALEGVKAKADFKIVNLDGRVLAESKEGRLVLDFKATPFERLEALQKFAAAAVRSSRSLDLEFKGESWKVKSSPSGIEVKAADVGVLRYRPGTQGPVPSKPSLVLEATPGVPMERAVYLVRMASELDPSLFKQTQVSLKGIPLLQSVPQRSAVGLLLRRALWGECDSFEIGNEVTFRRASKNPFQYSFSSSVNRGKSWTFFSEYLAYELSQGLGLKSAEDPRAEECVRFFRSASLQSEALHSYAPDAKKGEYVPYVEGKWTIPWLKAVGRMKAFAETPKGRQQLRETLDRIQDYSQKDQGHLLEFGPFDGLALADNAFEFMRIFEKAESDRTIDLSRILSEISVLFGKSGKLELYGAGVGIIYKARIPMGYDAAGRPKYDNAARNELDRLLEMKEELQKLDQPYRMTVIPEDRQQGSNYRTSTFTKTPEWIVEKIGPDGNPTKMLTVETKNQGAKDSDLKIQDIVEKATYQVTGHEFNASLNPGDSLVIIKFWDSKGLEGDLVSELQIALKKEYEKRLTLQRYPEHRGKADKMTRMRVKVIFEQTGEPSSSAWLEFDRKGQWKLREYKGSQFVDGTKWPEPLPKVAGW